VRSTFKAPGITSKLRPGWNGLPGTKTPASYENTSIIAVKSVITLCPGREYTVPGACTIKLLTAVIVAVS
jgi:hypothetical protein